MDTDKKVKIGKCFVFLLHLNRVCRDGKKFNWIWKYAFSLLKWNEWVSALLLLFSVQAMMNAFDRDGISGWGAVVHIIEKDKVTIVYNM